MAPRLHHQWVAAGGTLLPEVITGRRANLDAGTLAQREDRIARTPYCDPPGRQMLDAHAGRRAPEKEAGQ